MNKSLLYLLVVVGVLTSCSDSYSVQGTSSIAALDGSKLYLKALKSGDLEAFMKITESEAMQLHALMMCSNPSFILMKPNTLRIINTLYEFRRETDIPVCFTLDAGPNVHLLYPDQHAEMVERFIMDELEPYCHEGQWIADWVGNGPSRC